MTEESNVVSTREAAKLLGVSLRTVQLWVESGVLRAWKTPGNHRRVYLSSIERLIRERGGETPKVLIVEDDPIVQAYYQALFEQAEHPVELEMANDGFEGLLKVGANTPDLMIVDVDMPHMNGLQMLNSLKKTKSANDIRVAVVTGLTAAEMAERGTPPGDVPVFNKPLSMQAFKDILKMLPGQSGVATPAAAQSQGNQ